jgi:hypothetical protein
LPKERCINVVVTCAERKTLPTPRQLRLRSISRGRTDARCDEWIRRLKTDKGGTTSALELYGGNHWFVVKKIVERFGTGRNAVRLWIASAGYGLIASNAPVRSYAATFAAGEDSVGGRDDAQLWWSRLAKWTGPQPGQPRTLRDLAAKSKASPLLIVASASYVHAMEDDIIAATHALENPDQLAVISAGTSSVGLLGSYRLSVDGRFKQVVGGQMHALNVRVLQYALEKQESWAPDVAKLKKLFAKKLSKLPKAEAKVVTPLSDAQVLRWIRQTMKAKPADGYTPFLRVLRAQGKSCEQKRFKTLFMSIKTATSK